MTFSGYLSYDVCDDYGVWVVSPREDASGPWGDEYSAQQECNMRNFAAGIAKPNGELLWEPNLESPDEAFRLHHLSHPDCTCKGVIITGDQLATLLTTFKCECGYVPPEDEQCFEATDKELVFVCPQCSTRQSWSKKGVTQ